LSASSPKSAKSNCTTSWWRHGREVALALDELREQGVLARLDDGEWTLKAECTS
jgi:hypothetical protein